MRENTEDKEGSIGEVKRMSESDRERLHRLSEHQKRKKITMGIGKRRLVAQAEIDRLSALLSIPEETRLDSMEIYREAWENDLIHGRSIEKVLAASMYMACRKHNVPRTLDEIEDATKVGRKDIVKTCKLLANRTGAEACSNVSSGLCEQILR